MTKTVTNLPEKKAPRASFQLARFRVRETRLRSDVTRAMHEFVSEGRIEGDEGPTVEAAGIVMKSVGEALLFDTGIDFDRDLEKLADTVRPLLTQWCGCSIDFNQLLVELKEPE